VKGYVNVELSQLQEAILGYEEKRVEGKNLRDKGIDLFYEKYYVNGSYLTKMLNRNKTKMQFARSRLGPFSSWDDLLFEVLSDEEMNKLSWWVYNNTDYKIRPLKSLSSQCSTGFVLVDHEMASFIENCRRK